MNRTVFTSSESAATTPGPGTIVATGGGTYHHPPTSAVATGTLSVGDARLSPLWLPVAVTLDRIGVNVTTGAVSAVVRLGIFAANADLTPSSTLVLDAGTIDASTAGGKFATISQAVSHWACRRGHPLTSLPPLGATRPPGSPERLPLMRPSLGAWVVGTPSWCR